MGNELIMDGELFRFCPRCKEGKRHRYKFIRDKVMFFCNECGNLDIKTIPEEVNKNETKM